MLSVVLPDPSSAESLFGKKASKGEIAVIEERGAAAERSLRSLRKLEFLFLVQQIQQGDCSDALKVEGGAKGGNAEAQWQLGQLKFAGLCFPNNPADGMRWLLEAAKQGHADASCLVAVAYLNGEGTPKNPSAAYPFMRRAAEGGSPEAMVGLAAMLTDGTGAPKNPPEAAVWLEKATREGQVEANARLAALHLSGDLGRQDPAAALTWARPAADRGMPYAQLLAGFAASMTGNLVEAHKWFNLASGSDAPAIANAASQQRANVEASMVPGALAQARSLASSWKPKTLEDDLKQAAAPRITLPSYDAAKAARLSSDAARKELTRIGVGIDKDAFFAAARTDNLGVFILFHRAGADLNERLWPMGFTPLYMATDHGAEKVFEYLLRNGASVDIPDDETGMTPLTRAVSHSRPKMVNALLDAGATAAKPEGYSPEKTGNLLAGGSPLLYAIMSKDADHVLVRRLLDAGASAKEVYPQGKTTLMTAAGAPPAVFRLLLERGADPNAVDAFRESVLHHLVRESKVVMANINAALKAGARTQDWRSDQLTPLLRAVHSGHPEVTAALLAAGARPDLPMRISKDQIPMNWGQVERQLAMEGGTPLMLAVAVGNAAVAKELIKAGANPTTEVNVGGKRLSAASMARESGNRVLVGALAKP